MDWTGWIQPYTAWSELETCAYTDMNRIANNINIMAGTSLKDDYTQDDIATKQQWEDIIDALDDLIDNEGYEAEERPDMSVTAHNLNVVEGIIEGLRDWIDKKEAQHVADVYAGDDLYAQDAGGDYVRGAD